MMKINVSFKVDCYNLAAIKKLESLGVLAPSQSQIDLVELDLKKQSKHEEVILTLQQRNEHCLKVPKRLRQKREAATKRPGELKRKGEHRVRN